MAKPSKVLVPSQRGLDEGQAREQDPELACLKGDLRLDDLRTFLVLAEELHFGRAALRLHVTVSGVSRRVTRVERQLGATLVERSARPVQLTPMGHKVPSAAQTALAGLDALQVAIEMSAEGTNSRPIWPDN